MLIVIYFSIMIKTDIVQSIHLTDEPGADIVRVLLLLLLITWVLGQVALL